MLLPTIRLATLPRSRRRYCYIVLFCFVGVKYRNCLRGIRIVCTCVGDRMVCLRWSHNLDTYSARAARLDLGVLAGCRQSVRVRTINRRTPYSIRRSYTYSYCWAHESLSLCTTHCTPDPKADQWILPTDNSRVPPQVGISPTATSGQVSVISELEEKKGSRVRGIPHNGPRR